MSVLYWTILSPMVTGISILIDILPIKRRGPKFIQTIGSELFRSHRTTIVIYEVLGGLLYWLFETYMSGFHIGLGVGITPDVTLGHIIDPVLNWIILSGMIAFLVVGRFNRAFLRRAYRYIAKENYKDWDSSEMSSSDAEDE